MWKGRFQKESSKRLQDFTQSISFDWRLYQQDIACSIAHARALRNAGLLTEAEFVSINRGLDQIRDDLAAGRIPFSAALEDIHMHIEAELTRRIGAPGAKLQTARSRNDQVATDLRMFIRQELITVRQHVAQLQRALWLQAWKHRNAILPGYTHLQRAQPVPLALHLMAYLEMLERDKARIRDASDRLNECPLGSAALAGSTIVLDRAAIAKELGFKAPCLNTMDAVSSRDFACETLATLAILGVNISRLCEDVVLWCTAEFGFLRLSDAHSTGSSLMPQKKNPDLAELGRGKAGRLIGNLNTLLIVLKGLPLTYNRDLQEDKEPLFDSLNTIKPLLLVLAEMFLQAEFDTAQMARAASDPALLATDLADLLVRRGVPFRQAHEQVGKLVAQAEKLRLPLNKLPEDIIKQIAPEAAAGYAEIFDTNRAMQARKAPGAAAPEKIAERIEWWWRKLREELPDEDFPAPTELFPS